MVLRYGTAKYLILVGIFDQLKKPTADILTNNNECYVVNRLKGMLV